MPQVVKARTANVSEKVCHQIFRTMIHNCWKRCRTKNTQSLLISATCSLASPSISHNAYLNDIDEQLTLSGSPTDLPNGSGNLTVVNWPCCWWWCCWWPEQWYKLWGWWWWWWWIIDNLCCRWYCQVWWHCRLQPSTCLAFYLGRVSTREIIPQSSFIIPQ